MPKVNLSNMTAEEIEEYFDYEDFKSNREKTISKGPSRHWCMYCDRDIVNNGEKCGNCGKRDPNKGIKL